MGQAVNMFFTHGFPWCYFRFPKMRLSKICLKLQRVLLVPDRRGFRRQKIDQHQPEHRPKLTHIAQALMVVDRYYVLKLGGVSCVWVLGRFPPFTNTHIDNHPLNTTEHNPKQQKTTLLKHQTLTTNTPPRILQETPKNP